MTMCVDVPLLLFAKAPVPGQVKTRLTSHCTPDQAAAIAEHLLEASIQVAVDAWPGKVSLSVWLDHEHPFFVEMLARYPITMTRQCDGDLGQKMRSALALSGYPSAVMGCDVPHIPATTLAQAHQHLVNGKSVIGPAIDGGYYLLGLSRDADDLFDGKHWGEKSVLADTYASAEQLSLPLQKLAPLNDVDEWSDLLDAAKELPALGNYLLAQKLL